ncbi:MAG: amino acid carrier protein [Gammaproteobacteria bacterium]|nr:amino acid carrier protein [Gammaproteobacteria bacterium]
MTNLETLAVAFADFVWGTPLLVLMVGGGLFFALYSRFLPYRHLPHAIGIMLGRYDTPGAEGELSHAQALAAALSGTLGLGNIAGVALAIVAGGPGAVFWMWVSALVGIATKFFTCSLGIMYRGRDSLGQLQGGPQYIIREALHKRFYPLAILFSAAGIIGTLPMFQTNQLTALIRDTAAVSGDPLLFNLLTGCVIATVVGSVIFGGLSRVAQVSVALLPTMTLTYLGMTAYVLISHAGEVPAMFALILTEAFNPQALGGGLMGVILVGISRGAFSNEAGLGTEVMAHGAARTSEPIREGLVATLGPVIDTLIVCSCTALVILLSGLWREPAGLSGISMTMTAFRSDMGVIGVVLLSVQVLILSLTTMFTGWYYGAKCFGFLAGAQHQHWFRYFFLAAIVFGATASIDVVFNLIIGAYGLMAIPTMTATLLLSGKVMQAAHDYFSRPLQPNRGHLEATEKAPL